MQGVLGRGSGTNGKARVCRETQRLASSEKENLKAGVAELKKAEINGKKPGEPPLLGEGVGGPDS